MKGPLLKPLLFFLVLCCLPLFGFSQVPAPKWVDDFGGTGDSKPTGMVVDKQNNIYISGYFSGTVDFDPKAGVKKLTSVGGYDIYVAKYKPDGTLVWAESMGGNGLDQVNCMAIDKNGNITLTGQFQSTNLDADPGPGVFTLSSVGSDDIFAIHLDNTGKFLWAKSIGGAETDRGEEVATDSQGNIILTSIFQSPIAVGSSSYSSSSGAYNGLIIKYNPSGAVLWSVNIGSPGDSGAFGVRTDNNDNIAISGVFSGTANFNPLGTVNNITASTNDAPFVAEYNSSGNLIWVHSGNGNLSTNQSVISVDNNNNVYFSAANRSVLTFNGGVTINPGMFIAKYSSAGKFRFAKSINGPGSGYVYQLVNDQNNNVYFAGYFTGTLDFDPSSAVANVSYHGQRDFFIGKYDTDGNYKFAFSAGSSSCDLTLGIELAIDYNNNVVLGGSFCSTVNFDASGCSKDNVTAINGISDSFIAKYAVGSPASITNNRIIAPSDTVFCGSGSPSVITGSTPSGGIGTYAYQWENSTDGVNFTDISGATEINYAPKSISSNNYYRRKVSSGSCTSPTYSNIVSFKVQTSLSGNVITAPAVTSFCSGGAPAAITGSTPIGGSGSYTYQWQNSANNANFTDIAGATAKDYDPSLVTSTTYYRRTITSGSCTTPVISNVITIRVNSSPATPVPVASVVTICSGLAATLSVASPQHSLTYNWYDSPSKSKLLYTGVTYTTPPLSSGTIFYVEAENSTCSSPSMASVQVIVKTLPVAPAVSASRISVCDGSVAKLGIAGPKAGYQYNWYTSASGGSVVYSGTNFTTPAITATVTYYAEAAGSSGCVSDTRTAVTVTDNPLPKLSAPNVSVCPGSNAVLTASSTDVNAVITWYQSSVGGSVLGSGSSFTTPALNSDATYYAEAIDNSTGCMTASRIAVAVHMLQPLAAPIVTVAAASTSSITFNWSAVSGAVGYQVSTDNGQTFAGPSSGGKGLSHTVSGLQPGQSVTIIVRAIGGQSCELGAGSAAVTAVSDNPSENMIYVPNAFTPNGDGVNDEVHVHSESIRSMKFFVYDQWGELIFTTANMQTGWDGTYKGTHEPAGVYVYYVKAIMNDGQTTTKKGTITLLR